MIWNGFILVLHFQFFGVLHLFIKFLCYFLAVNKDKFFYLRLIFLIAAPPKIPSTTPPVTSPTHWPQHKAWDKAHGLGNAEGPFWPFRYSTAQSRLDFTAHNCNYQPLLQLQPRSPSHFYSFPSAEPGRKTDGLSLPALLQGTSREVHSQAASAVPFSSTTFINSAAQHPNYSFLASASIFMSRSGWFHLITAASLLFHYCCTGTAHTGIN